jgi:hypothetical protein
MALRTFGGVIECAMEREKKVPGGVVFSAREIS